MALIGAHGLPDGERQALLVRLEQRLVDTERPLTFAEIGVLAARSGVGEDVLRRILPRIEERIAAMPDPDPDVLETLV